MPVTAATAGEAAVGVLPLTKEELPLLPWPLPDIGLLRLTTGDFDAAVMLDGSKVEKVDDDGDA